MFFLLNPNRLLGLAWILFFRRVDFVWLLMSNSELLRIKNKQKTPYKKQKTASSYKILSLNGLMTVLGLYKKWARCLPNRGKLLSQQGHAACPCWAELLSDTCPISSFCSTHITVFRILPTHAIPVV